jgi:TolC family type I secretion outer membrane protein
MASTAIGLALAAALWLGAAAPAVAETFAEALATAYATNPTLQARRARLRSTDETVPQALANWRPRVTASASKGKQDSDTLNETATTSSTTSLSRDPQTAQITVTQPIYRGGRTVSATRSAENGVLAERARLVAAEQSVLIDAATSYMDVVRDEATLELNITNEQRLQRQLEAAQDRFRVGEITRTDVAQAESRLAQATAARIGAEGQLAISRATYRRVMGEFPATVSPPSRPKGLPATREEAQTQSSNNNPNVIAAEYAEMGARDDVRTVAGELLPEISLVGDIARSEDSSSTASTARADTRSITARVTMPLYEAGSITSRYRQANQNLGQRRNEVDEARRAAVESATRSFEQYETARARFESFSQVIAAAEIALDGVQQEASVGTRTVLDVLDAEQELLTAQVNQVQAARDEFVATYQLLAAVGRFTAIDLALPVELYDAEAYYRRVRNKWWGLSAGDGN